MNDGIRRRSFKTTIRVDVESKEDSSLNELRAYLNLYASIFLDSGFSPFLWTKEGSVEGSDRRAIPVEEAFDLKVGIVRQSGESSNRIIVRTQADDRYGQARSQGTADEGIS